MLDAEALVSPSFLSKSGQERGGRKDLDKHGGVVQQGYVLQEQFDFAESQKLVLLKLLWAA